MMKCITYPVIYSREDEQNLYNYGLTTALQSSKRSKYLSRKIHQLKKILKLRCSKAKAKPPTVDQLTEEERQNTENERINDKCSDPLRSSHSAGSLWENWDACRLCATTNEADATRNGQRQHSPDRLHSARTHSVCYVFMPDRFEPVAVKLRTARIAGGVICVSYRPDVDIRSNNNHARSYTSFQRPQAQQALKSIMV